MITKEETRRALVCAIKRKKTYPEMGLETWVKYIRAEVDELGYSYPWQLSKHIPNFSEDEEELADVVITCMSMAEWYGTDLGKVIEMKMKFNEIRED